MTIRTTLRLSTIIQIGLVVAIGVVLLGTFRASTRTQGNLTSTVKIGEAITELRFVMTENLLNHDARSAAQWHAKYATVGALLQSVSADSPEEEQIIKGIVSQQMTIKSLFERLVATYRETDQDQTILRDLRERLVAQLLIKQQKQIAGIVQLTKLHQEAINTQQMRVGVFMLGIMILILAITIGNTLTVGSIITRSLARLQKGAEAIASGHLSYRIEVGRVDEFGQLAAAFNAMASSLQRLNMQKAQFITIAAHQLRTPLTVIGWNVEDVLSSAVRRLKPDETDALRTVAKANSTLSSRIDDLLVAANIDAYGVRLGKKPVDLSSLTYSVLDELQEGITTKRLNVQVMSPPHPLPSVQADEITIRSVLRKLVENALLYTNPGDTITLRFRPKDQWLRFEIKDTGIGIPAHEQANIFGRFVRASNAMLAFPDASGLSLYVAKRIITAHRGHIGFTSRESKGSMFWFELPLV